MVRENHKYRYRQYEICESLGNVALSRRLEFMVTEKIRRIHKLYVMKKFDIEKKLKKS